MKLNTDKVTIIKAAAILLVLSSVLFLSAVLAQISYADETPSNTNASNSSSETHEPYKLPEFVTQGQNSGEDTETYTDNSGTEVTDEDYYEYEEDEAQVAVRNEQGQLSRLNPYTHNPYNSQKVVIFDIGAEFATYEGDNLTEGIVIKCAPGDVLSIPTVVAKSGYTFVGWSQGGVPEEIDWKSRMKEVEIGENIEEKHVYVYAIYADDAGNGYCTCGAYTEGVYTDELDTLKQEYKDYLSARGVWTFPIPLPVLIIGVIIVVGIVAYIFIPRKNERVEYVSDKNKKKNDNESSK